MGSVSKWRETKFARNEKCELAMEILPILESNDSPKPNVWYVLSPDGDAPCIRVGHTCTFVAGEVRRVLVIGGANPDGSFADVYSLDLGSLLKFTGHCFKSQVINRFSRRGGLCGPGSWLGYCVFCVLGKTLDFHSASLHPGV